MTDALDLFAGPGGWSVACRALGVYEVGVEWDADACASGIVSAEQWGVPQTRRRAVLLAHRDRPVRMPVPTHSRYYSDDPTYLDRGLEPWVSMAEALGWSPDGLVGFPRRAPTITGKGTATVRVNDQSGTPRDADWPTKRPATTVAGRDLIADPGTNSNRFNGSTKSRNDGVRVTVADAGVLQGFPADYPWQGSKTSQHQQVGDAVPPPLAAAILRELL